MRKVFLSTTFIFLNSLLFTQVLSLRVGMAEKEMIRCAMPSRMESNMEFLHRETNKVSFKQVVDDTYTLWVTITLHKGYIQEIRKEHEGTSLEMRKIIFSDFVNSIKSRERRPDLKANEKLARNYVRDYLDQGARCKAFTNKAASREEIFLFYSLKNSSNYIEIIADS